MALPLFSLLTLDYGEDYKAGMRHRWIEDSLGKQLAKPFVHIVFGARQTGKTTLLTELLPHPAIHLNLADPEERTRHLANPGLFRQECEALPDSGRSHVVFVDEAQAVPSIFDAVQVLYDRNKTRWRFVLCGSSARKLRKAGANLLPGRCMLHRLFPLVLAERPAPPAHDAPFRPPLIDLTSASTPRDAFPAADIEERLAFGELPGVALLADEDRRTILKSFVAVHLEEEIRREALVKDWGAFVNFLRLAALESGQTTNYSAIAREAGVSLPTVKAHYQLLEDLFIGFSVPAYAKSPRKNLLSTPRFFFFDLGIRHAAAGLVPDRNVVRTDPGRYFEQWVGIEIWKRLQYRGEGQLHHFRTKDGAEVDFIVELGDRVIPIEVKWTDRPRMHDATCLTAFLRDHPRAKTGYVICRCPRPLQLSDTVTALPWRQL
jgi:predicted AAA+ superfamily ATPase